MCRFIRIAAARLVTWINKRDEMRSTAHLRAHSLREPVV